VLVLAGVYAAFQVPISVFPDTNFPRVVIGVDNGVMPVEQMQVMITKPIEDAVNSVPGLATVRSTTSRGTAEVSLFFAWNVNMFQTLQLADAALSKVRQTLPATAVITTNRLTFATFPILGYALTADAQGPNAIPPTRLWEIATYDLDRPRDRGDHHQPSHLRHLPHPWLRAHRRCSRPQCNSPNSTLGDRHLRSRSSPRPR